MGSCGAALHPRPQLRRENWTDLCGSWGFAFDEEYIRDLAGRSYERAYNPRGYLRQLAACVGQPDRRRKRQKNWPDVPQGDGSSGDRDRAGCGWGLS